MCDGGGMGAALCVGGGESWRAAVYECVAIMVNRSSSQCFIHVN